MKRAKLILWDMDGTLLNTIEDLRDSLNASLAEFSLPQRSLDEVRRFVGNGILRLIQRAAPADSSEAQISAIFDFFCGYYAKHSREKTRPYPGILPLLQDLQAQGQQMAVVSNKLETVAQEMSREYFGEIFPLTIGDRPGLEKKPAPDMILAAMEHFRVSREDCLLIGDSEVDIATARNAGISCISVSWGFRSRETLLAQGAEQIAGTVPELRLLLGLE